MPVLKILQVIDRLEIGGAERVFLDLTHLLLNENLQVDTLLISGKGPLIGQLDPRSCSFFLDRQKKYSVVKMLECAAICSKYQVVHVHMRHTYSYVKLSQIISLRKFKIVLHDHYGDIDIDQKVPFTLQGIFKPDYYIGVSEQLVGWAKSQLKIDTRKAILLRNTIIPTEEKCQLPIDQDMLMTSNIRPTKNLELAIQLANLAERKLLVFGNAFDSKYSKNILTTIAKSSYVKLVQDETSVQRYFGNFNIAIHTAYSETGPLVLMEYLAQGLPFLAHETGEVANVLKHEIPECFIDTLDTTAWLEKLAFLKINPPQQGKLKHLFEKHFGPQQYSNRCIKIYKQLVAF